MNNRSVLQDWLLALPVMQQTVLIECVRGPDTITKYHPSKFLLRWYRRCILLSAFDGRALTNPCDEGGGSFTGPSFAAPPNSFLRENWEIPMNDLIGKYLRGVDEMPHHFHLHFLHAIEIIGYKHPDQRIKKWWNEVYERFVKDMHLGIETENEMNRRLGDSREQWLETADKATIA